jgi:hypothetical protein
VVTTTDILCACLADCSQETPAGPREASAVSFLPNQDGQTKVHEDACEMSYPRGCLLVSVLSNFIYQIFWSDQALERLSFPRTSSLIFKLGCDYSIGFRNCHHSHLWHNMDIALIDCF